MHILSLALGGCLRGEPVSYGITEDTGGHITYILGEMRALAARDDVAMAEIVTRRFNDAALGAIHDRRDEVLGPKLRIRRIDSGNRRYLAKEELARDRDAFTRALIADLKVRDRLPDIIHAHFADAADVAIAVEAALGIPFIYTAHSLGMDKRRAGDASTALDARIAQEDAAIGNAAAIVGSSRDECERQIGAYPSARLDRIHVLEPGVERADRSDSHRQAAIEAIAPFLREPAKPIVLAIARPVRKKNLLTLIEAFAADDTLRETCNLVILAGQRRSLQDGGAEQREVLGDIVHAVDRHDLYGRIAYPKFHDAGHVAGLYRLAAETGGVFVNPALVEPYGLTICEAATFGLPVVATNVGGPVDSVRKLAHGILVDPNDRAAIGRSIRDLISDPARWRELSENGQRHATAMNWGRYADGFLRIARDVLTPKIEVAAMRPHSIVVSDLDNTLTGCTAGARRLAAFFARRKPDFGFVAATGRSIIEAQRIVREWDLPRPLAYITSTGSEIYWQRNDGLHRDDRYSEAIAANWNPDGVSVALSGIDGLVPQPVYEQRDFKRSYFYKGEQTLRRVETALAEAGLKAAIIASHGDLLDILPAGTGKGTAMQHVAKTMGIPASAVFAIGDSGNDLDMLTQCENAVMVGIHAPELAGLGSRANVYVSRRHHAAGALEGIFAHHKRQRRLSAERRRVS
ncbi:MAG: HAD-IIB family hydrolase [Pontixanthobacter sp.]